MLQFVFSKFDPTEIPLLSIEEDKKKTLNLILYITAGIGMISVVLSILEYIQYGFKISSFLFFVLYSPILFAFIFKSKLEMNTISRLIIGSAYLVGVYIMKNEGFFGATLLIFIAISVYATLLLGIKEGIIVVLLSVLSIILAAFLFVNENLDIQSLILTSYKNYLTWLNITITFIMLALVLNVSIYRIQRKLVNSFKYSELKAIELSKTNEELNNLKNELESKVLERTNEIKANNEALMKSNSDLKIVNDELERLNQLFVGREFRIKELRDKVKELEEQQKIT